ncbi:cyclic nucleotide-binding and patatin-like phospholipase domain-containing protein [Pseudorhodoferax sp.]|uniref:cyclic nucleotide-binding and patatin-like phospholipase domain-containing protein n=1 Tax=Pseudorhodoferax sp. TaxID=1993553 RepID=UPI002DD66A74|nr:cyclic nucleotide-binding and patatin-like phospholipase domain-containing protein [Pseudorhodoferax sp.]
MDSSTARQRFHDELLARHLKAIFGEVEAAALAHLRQHLRWVEIAGGDTLMHQGEEGDSMYLIVSGRLRAYVRGDDGSERMVGEMARGQTVGEMSLYTGEPRAATVVAVRDSVLVRLAKSEFTQLLQSSAQVSIALTRQIIQRLKGEQRHQTHERPVAISLLPITTGVDTAGLARELARQIGERLVQTHGHGHDRVRIVDAAQIGQTLAAAGVALDDPDPEARAEASRRVALLLDEVEATHDAVLLVADPGPTAWTQRCCRHCDELLLLADAAQPAALHDIEQQFLMHRPPRTEVAEVLVLLHPADRRSPQDSAPWLERRPLAGHVHLRPTLPRDMARLARLLTRTGVGLVLAGGGARGFAHLGVYRALCEQGVDIDWVGGTSIGAVMAAYVASDQSLDTVMANAHDAFAVNPTGDMNLFPLISLFKGVRLRGVLRRAVQQLVGFDANIEDLWKNYHCVATNYSRAREQRIAHGDLVQALLASISIPGALPPVVRDGELLCDGGTFNNFPVDQMRRMRGVGYVIGVNLNLRGTTQVPPDGIPGNISLWRDRLRPPAQRQYRLPSLPTYLMTVTGLYSMSRQPEAQQNCDLYFHPALDRVGMLQWKSIDQIIARGYAHAKAVIAAMDGTLKRQLGLGEVSAADPAPGSTAPTQ